MEIASIREFKARASEFIRLRKPVLVLRGGRPAGVFVPWEDIEAEDEVRRAALRALAEKIAGERARKGIKEEEVREDFAAFQKGCRGMALEELLKERREEILRICAEYGARKVRVFGSLARGEADEGSDIDFLVEMEPGRSLFDLGGLQQELEDLLGCRVDVITERGLKARIRGRVLQEAVPL